MGVHLCMWGQVLTDARGKMRWILWAWLQTAVATSLGAGIPDSDPLTNQQLLPAQLPSWLPFAYFRLIFILHLLLFFCLKIFSYNIFWFWFSPSLISSLILSTSIYKMNNNKKVLISLFLRLKQISRFLYSLAGEPKMLSKVLSTDMLLYLASHIYIHLDIHG